MLQRLCLEEKKMVRKWLDFDGVPRDLFYFRTCAVTGADVDFNRIEQKTTKFYHPHRPVEEVSR